MQQNAILRLEISRRATFGVPQQPHARRAPCRPAPLRAVSAVVSFGAESRRRPNPFPRTSTRTGRRKRKRTPRSRRIRREAIPVSAATDPSSPERQSAPALVSIAPWRPSFSRGPLGVADPAHPYDALRRRDDPHPVGPGLSARIDLCELPSNRAGDLFRCFGTSRMTAMSAMYRRLWVEPLTRGLPQRCMVVMANVISPYSQGRQPCRAFQEDRLNKARTCPRCTTTVQWCRGCAQNHHSGGWETCPGQKK